MSPFIHRSNLLPLAAIIGFGLCYAQVIRSVVETWSNNYLYSYGFVVPIICGYLLWAKSGELRAQHRAPDHIPGILTILLGVGLLLLGHVATVDSIEQVSIVVTLLGLTLFFTGRRGLKLTWFPIAYLLIAIPIWDRVIGALQVPSQQLSAAISVAFLRFCGIPAAHEGTFVTLPNLTLEVLQECSGVNQLISVVAMALPAAYLWLNAHWRRVALIVMAVAIAYLSNGLRIALVGFLGYYGWGDGHLGALHLVEGLAVSLVGYGFLLVCLSVLARPRHPSAGPTPAGVVDPPAVSHSTSARWADVALVLVLVVAGTFRLSFKPTSVAATQQLLGFPSQIGEWRAGPVLTGPTFRVVGADEELARAYRNATGDTIRLYIGYQEYQGDGKELPDPASRTPAAKSSRLELALPFETVHVNESVVARAGRQAGTLFWYDLNGRIVASRYRAKGYVILDTLTRWRSNGALVTVDWDSPAGGDFEASRKRAIGFVRALLPILPRYLAS